LCEPLFSASVHLLNVPNGLKQTVCVYLLLYFVLEFFFVRLSMEIIKGFHVKQKKSSRTKYNKK